jgi:hypothetical protein
MIALAGDHAGFTGEERHVRRLNKLRVLKIRYQRGA